MPSTSPEAAIIKYLNDKTVVFNNQIIPGLLLLSILFKYHGHKQCQTPTGASSNIKVVRVPVGNVHDTP